MTYGIYFLNHLQDDNVNHEYDDVNAIHVDVSYDNEQDIPVYDEEDIHVDASDDEFHYPK